MFDWNKAINTGTLTTALLIFAVGFTFWAAAKEKEAKIKLRKKSSKKK